MALQIDTYQSEWLDELAKQDGFGQGRFEPLKLCEHCVLSKAKRQKFPTSTHFRNAALDYMHANLWGPLRTESHGGARYFPSLVDDFSKKVWVWL